MARTHSSQVRKAAKWLDKVSPGWVYKVKMSRLDLEDECDCILGQVYAREADNDGYDGQGWVWAMDNVPGVSGHAEVFEDGFAFGRDFLDPVKRTEYEHNLWKDEIRARRGKSGTRGNR